MQPLLTYRINAVRRAFRSNVAIRARVAGGPSFNSRLRLVLIESWHRSAAASEHVAMVTPRSRVGAIYRLLWVKPTDCVGSGRAGRAARDHSSTR